MKKSLFLGTLAAAGLMAGVASAGTLEDVQAAGVLKCGIGTGNAGFGAPNAEGYWEGLDVAVCRAVAAAVLKDQDKVEFIPLTSKVRFSALGSREVDMLSRTTTWTFSRDVDLGFTFLGVNYYDGQAFIVPNALGVKSALELDGTTVCITSGTTTELNLADYFRANGMTFDPVPIETRVEAAAQLQAGACDVFTADGSALASARSTFEDPEAWTILPEIISKEPLGPVVRQGDEQWGDVVRWSLNALIAAEELGITRDNIEGMLDGTNNPSINRLLGNEGGLGEMLGLDDRWAARAIAANGNYGEIFADTIGEDTIIGLPRGINALWTDGGLMYAPPFR